MRSSFGSALIVPFAFFVLLGGARVFAQEAAPAGQAPPAQNPSPERPCDRYGFSTIFRCIPHDLRNIARGDSLVWLGTGAFLGGGSVLLDDEVRNAMIDDRPDTSLAAGAALGHAGLHFGAPLLLYAVARTIHHDDAAAFSVALLRTQVLTAGVTRGLKLVPRARPYQEKATLTKGSFPSGHASAMFATATVMQRRWGSKAGVPAYLLATYVGATRLQNMHYLSDVTFGAALGVAAGLAVNLPSRRATITPLVARGTTGIAVGINLSPPAPSD